MQQILRDSNRRPKHRFSWSCPHCGQWLPAFKAITVNAVEAVKPELVDATVFFLDRLSRANLMLAAEASSNGAIVVFEPSGKASDKLLAEALRLAHIAKYADERLDGLSGAMTEGAATLLEIQTLGKKGLTYRHKIGGILSNWIFLKALHVPRLVDTCGSGDWCTAGLIAKVAGRGQVGLRSIEAHGIEAALRYGQALSA